MAITYKQPSLKHASHWHASSGSEGLTMMWCVSCKAGNTPSLANDTSTSGCSNRMSKHEPQKASFIYIVWMRVFN